MNLITYIKYANWIIYNLRSINLVQSCLSVLCTLCCLSSQVGSAGRSEKIRTFNFKQDRVTDHRLSENMYNINEFLAGGDMLSEMISSLHLLARNEQLLELVTKTTKKK